MNQCNMIGRLVRDPELRFVASTGKAVANFTLAVNRQFKQEDGPSADFFRVTIWGKQAENAAKYLTKGSQCAVAGRIEINSYTDKDGNQRQSVDLQAERIEYLSKAKTDDYSSGVEVEYGDYPEISDDEVPF